MKFAIRDTTQKLHDAVTSAPAKITAGLLATYFCGLSLMVSESYFFEKEDLRDLGSAIESRLRLPAVANGRCFYVDPDWAKKVSFREFPTGFVSGVYRLGMPFADSQKRTHDLGAAPYLVQAPCSFLKDDVALHPVQARKLIDDWREAFMASPGLRQAIQEARSGEGLLHVEVGDKPFVPYRP